MNKKIFILLFFMSVLISVSAVSAVDLDDNNGTVALSNDADALASANDVNAIDDLKNVTSGVPPVIGPTPNLIGCLEAMEAYKIITGVGKVTVAPKILTFDLLDLSSFFMDEL